MTNPIQFQPETVPETRKMLCYGHVFSAEEIGFWRRVTKNESCLEWMGARKNGYGSFYIQGKTRIASRYAWEVTRGPIPPGLSVLHHCDNPACVNPDHLFLGTHDDNMRDMVAKGRQKNGIQLGEKHPNSKITSKQVSEIRSRLANGESQGSLAKEYGVSKPTIARAAFGRTWRHISHPCSYSTGPKPKPTKLTSGQVYELRHRFDNGESPSRLAREFGVSWTTADRIGRRLDWQSLPEADRFSTTVLTPGEY